MKFQTSEVPVGKPQPRRKTSKLAPLLALIILLTIPLYYPSIVKDSSKILQETSSSNEPLVGLVSHVEGPASENTKDPCSIDSSKCRDGGDTAAEPYVLPGKKKHEKGRRKRIRRSRNDFSASERRGDDQIMSRDKDKLQQTRRRNDRGVSGEERCDLFSGEWVPDSAGPYYSNESCSAIQEHQNCLKFGRPDTGFLKWRWKPDNCELPPFDPQQFLQLVSGKSIAFVGDSVARNHMQSLICLLSRVENPVDVSGPILDQNKRYEYRDHDFNISMLWSPYLVKTEKTDPDDDKRAFHLYLDEFDEHWTTKITPFDYVIISAGHWFFRPTYFHVNRRLIGCLYCPDPNIRHFTSQFSYRRAFRTAFRAINTAGFDGVTFLRTFAPSHFEGAAWDKGGDCRRTRPYRRSEVVLEDYSLEMYQIQLEELRIAQRAGRRTGGKFRLLDATVAMLLRPDGHPSKYGHWPVANQTIANDCVHWCLPGPIDAWNDFLQELLKREIGDYAW